ncbi:MAG: CRISPR-associated helicase Cas3' [candidate division KSB1 bacterium]|nr:CRISPR-associated helicase Cas3' [candidate division KSB1 bacterium]
MKNKPLLAKRPKIPGRPEFQETLLGHTKAVMDCFKHMFGSSPETNTRLRQLWLKFFRLNQNIAESFYINTLLACFLHDLGKANNYFQNLVIYGKGMQSIRHEHLSGLIILISPFQDILKNIPLANIHIILSAVIGHHLRVNHQEFGQCLNPDIKTFQVYGEDIIQLWNNLCAYLGIGEPIMLDIIPNLWSFFNGPCASVEKIRKNCLVILRQFKLELKKNVSLHRLLIAVRAALILADSAGSALVRENRNLKYWLSSAFGETVLDASYIEKQVIVPRIKQIEIKRRKKFAWDGFQDAAEILPARSLLLAPCGSGKTLAAWRWIKARLNEQPASRVSFLYPTRATATEGFKDYVAWAPEADAALIHGTATYELEGLFSNPEDERAGKDFATDERLFALGFWQRRVFSATVDQFLGFMQQIYSSVCLLPLLADCVLVIDEVHSFDRNLFSVLKRFLKEFDLPVLCMTASLPPNRRQELIDCGLCLFPEDLRDFPDLEGKAASPRYQVQVLDNSIAAQEVALKKYHLGKKVLWVVNTVSRCQALARSLTGIQFLCYHSRFKLEDRKQRHDKVIKAFQHDNPGPRLALTTQVCEMSLDLDAEVLVSEIAPITSMIQRLGRCNRHFRPGEGRLGEVYFYPPEDWAPYRQEDLVGHEPFLRKLDGRQVSQLELSYLLEEYGPAEVEVEKLAAFLEDGPWAQTREQSLREEQNFTVNVILDCDLKEYLERRRLRQPGDGLLVPVPRRFASRHPWLGSFPLVAPSSHYHPQYGFLDYPWEEII